MANHDYVLANQAGASFRADLNNLAQAIASLNSGTSDPSATFSVAYMPWADTSTGLLKIRNAANSAWVTVGTLASSYLGLITHALATAKGDILAATGSGAFAKLALGSNTYRPEADSSQTSGIKWSSVLPSVQIFTSGSGTYTTPSGVKAIKVRLIGGGGQGGGGGGAGATQGGAGGDTTFGSLTAGGGGGGHTGGATFTGGSGGSATGCDLDISGTNGSNTSTSTITVASSGYLGASGAFGGGILGLRDSGQSPQAQAANTGAGGHGGGAAAGTVVGAGGGSGAYGEKLITSPAASYSYAVGAGGSGAGAAGTNGSAGGDGGSGVIIVEEFR